MADLCSKRKLAAMTADMHQPVANIRKLAVEGRRIKVPKTSRDIDTVTFEPKDPRKSSALALMDPKHYRRNYGLQFLLLKPVVEGRPWIAVLLFRGSYWAAESHIGRHEAKKKVAERAFSWLYSCDLHVSSHNCRYLTKKPYAASSRGQKGNGVWELEFDWTALKTQSIPIVLPQWKTSISEPFLVFFGEPTRKDATFAKLGDPLSSTNNTTLPRYLRVSAAFRFHKKRAAVSESMPRVSATSCSTAHQSLPSVSDAQDQKEYTPCASDMRLLKYTSGPRLVVLWKVLQIPIKVPRLLDVYTPCPPNMQLVKYTPRMSLETLCGVRQRLIESVVRKNTVELDFLAEVTIEEETVAENSLDNTTTAEISPQEVATFVDRDNTCEEAVFSTATPAGRSPQDHTSSADDGITYEEAMETEQSSTTYVETANRGEEIPFVGQNGQYMSQDRPGIFNPPSQTLDMGIYEVTGMQVDDESELEIEDNDTDIEMEDDDGLDPASVAWEVSPGNWTSEIAKSSAPETSMEVRAGGEEQEEDTSRNESENQDLRLEPEHPVDEEDSSPDSDVTRGSDDIEDRNSDTASEPPSDFEDHNPFEEKGKEGTDEKEGEEGEDGGYGGYGEEGEESEEDEGGEVSDDAQDRETSPPTQTPTTTTASDADGITSQLETFSLGADSAPPPSTSTSTSTSTAASSGPGSSAVAGSSPSANTDISTDFSQARRHPGAESDSESGDTGKSDSEDDGEERKKMTDEEIDELADGGLSSLRV
ncbi:hypothetical protein IFR04_002624 [Cadophora malorum]|uniref:Uncharacterized protein n=1 Tax=Cadophora malorum TaxID=108018 RepID=A0A8H8BU57_9HELO|nr:hypothetical protein IFR04_002624 [Cadophora malorum]